MFDEASLSRALGRPAVFRAECESTSAIALELARAGAPAGTLVVAEHQTAGRGRRGRTWEAEAGQNLLFSLVLRPPLPPHQAPRAALLWAAAIAGALGCWLKWPNDLIDADYRKLGGILPEMDAEGGALRHVVLGVGINVNQQEFPGLPQATSLRLLRGAPVDRLEALAAVVAAIEAANVTGSLDPWRARSLTLGRRVRVGDLEGLASAIREDGALIVGGQAVLTGDVELISTPRGG